MGDELRVGAPQRRVRRMLLIVIVVVISGMIALLFAVVFGMRDRDGDDLASEQAERVARALAEDLGRLREPIDAETVAFERFTSGSATIEPLSWTGTAGPGEVMVIEARISETVAENSIGGFFGPFNSAGSASRCYRYSLVALQDAHFEEIPCKGLPVPSAPPSSHRPALPDDAAKRVEEVLATTPASELAAVLQSEFSQAEYTVDTAETPDGELVAAVGVAPGVDCVLRVRLSSGEIIAPAYDRIWLEPGETGCSTELYTAPPQ